MHETSEHVESRIKKLREIEAMGVNAFGGLHEFSDHAAELHQKHDCATKEALEATPVTCSVAGRVIRPRSFGKAMFAQLQDATGGIQMYMKKDVLAESFDIIKKLDEGDIVGVEGILFRTRTDELTIEVRKFTFLTKSLRPLPEKWHGLKDIETRYRQRYVDLIVNPEVKDTFRKRSAIIKSMRDYLEAHGFIEVETPMMQAIPGGASARPFVTHHNALGIDLFLRIAPELYLKRLLVGGFERVFELNRNFRNEGVSTKHNPEFTMIEFYVAYKDYNFLMDFTETLINNIAMKALGSENVKFGDHIIDLTPPWTRKTFYASMIERGVPAEILKNPVAAKDWAVSECIDIPPLAPHSKVLDEIFSKRVEPFLIQPTFITDYPVELSPLAKRKPAEPDLVERFELFMAGWEIANAFSELNDPMDQRERFEEQVRTRESGDDEGHRMDEDFVCALEYGMPPAAGEGIGIDRLVMVLTDSHSIKDVILFPQMKPIVDHGAENAHIQTIQDPSDKKGR